MQGERPLDEIRDAAPATPRARSPLTIHLARAPTIDVPWVGAGGLPPRSRPAVGGRSLRAVGDLYRLPPVLPPEPNWSQRLRLEHARLATTTVRRHPTRRPWTRTGAQTAPSDRSCTTPAKGTPMHTQNKKKNGSGLAGEEFVARTVREALVTGSPWSTSHHCGRLGCPRPCSALSSYLCVASSRAEAAARHHHGSVAAKVSTKSPPPRGHR